MSHRSLAALSRFPSRRLAPVAAVMTLLLGACDREGSAQEARPAAADTAATAPAADTLGATRRRLPFGSTAAEAAACMARRQAEIRVAADSIAADSTAARPRRGEDPTIALSNGWFPEMPEFMAGSILPCARVVAYYGNPLSRRMGALGEFDPPEMFRRFDEQVAAWRAVDSTTPVIPAFHLVAVVAQQDAGRSGHYRTIMRDTLITRVHGWAREKDGIFFVDIQVGTDDIRNILPRLEWILREPDVHLGVDPEFMMKTGARPGTRVGSMDAADINYVSEYLATLVREHDLPPKIFVVHRFTRPMVTNYQRVVLRPEVHFVAHMDGWGRASLKRDSFHDYIVREPIQFTGFKIFYGNDTKRGDPLMTPAEVMRLVPVPLYIQYQ